jgi:transcriptional regulator with XRE-family HTH domain
LQSQATACNFTGMTTSASTGSPPAEDPERLSVNGAVLCRARKALRLTAAQIAARVLAGGDCYMSDSRVSKFERGKAGFPNPPLLTALSAAYEISVAEMTAPCETCGQPWVTDCIDHQDTARAAAKVA